MLPVTSAPASSRLVLPRGARVMRLPGALVQSALIKPLVYEQRSRFCLLRKPGTGWSRAARPCGPLRAYPNPSAEATGHTTEISRSAAEAGGNHENGALAAQNGSSNNSTSLASMADVDSKIQVQFVVPEYVTHWGQKLKLVGSVEELGSWKPEQAPDMRWHEGHFWTLDIQLPAGTVNFKIIMQQDDGVVRWELGDNRTIELPAIMPNCEAPVGSADVTCHWNDVKHSNITLRPNRDYLRAKLREVEAKVIAIQAKKRKLDRKMTQLNSGLQEFDRAVELLEGDVGKAMNGESLDDLSAADRAVGGASSSASIAAAASTAQPHPSSPAAAAAGPSRGFQVPILDPSELEPILPDGEDAFAAAVAAAEALVHAQSELDAAAVAGDSSLEQTLEDEAVAAELSQGLEAAAAAAAEGAPPAEATAAGTSRSSSSGEAAAAGAGLAPGYGGMPGYSSMPGEASMMQQISENVLSVTVNQLLAAAEDALEHDPRREMGVVAVDTTQLAADYLDELQDAAFALEQETDNRVAKLLATALRASGFGAVPEDIASLAAPVEPRIGSSSGSSSPGVASPVDGSSSPADAPSSPSSSITGSIEGEEGVGALKEGPGAPLEVVAAASATPAATGSSSGSSSGSGSGRVAPANVTVVASFTPNPAFVGGPGGGVPPQGLRDEVLSFSASDLNVDVDPAELLGRVLQRALSFKFSAESGDVAGAVGPEDGAALGQQRQQQEEVGLAGGLEVQWQPLGQVQEVDEEAEAVRLAAEVEARRMQKQQEAEARMAAAASMEEEEEEDEEGRVGNGGVQGPGPVNGFSSSTATPTSTPAVAAAAARYQPLDEVVFTFDSPLKRDVVTSSTSGSSKAVRGPNSQGLGSAVAAAAVERGQGRSSSPSSSFNADGLAEKLKAAAAAKQAAAEKVAAALRRVEDLREQAMASQTRAAVATSSTPPGPAAGNGGNGAEQQQQQETQDAQEVQAAAVAAHGQDGQEQQQHHDGQQQQQQQQEEEEERVESQKGLARVVGMLVLLSWLGSSTGLGGSISL